MNELLIIVLLAVHVEGNVDVISCYQKLFSVVLGNPLFHLVVDYDLFVISLVEFSVTVAFDDCLLGVISKLGYVQLCNVLVK